jgi:hypothetical protein
MAWTWLSKLVNVVTWPARAATLTVVYISRPFISGTLIVVRGFGAVMQGDDGNSDHLTSQEIAQTTPESVIPAEIESSATDSASEQLSTWAWGV